MTSNVRLLSRCSSPTLDPLDRRRWSHQFLVFYFPFSFLVVLTGNPLSTSSLPTSPVLVPSFFIIDNRGSERKKRNMPRGSSTSYKAKALSAKALAESLDVSAASVSGEYKILKREAPEIRNYVVQALENVREVLSEASNNDWIRTAGYSVPAEFSDWTKTGRSTLSIVSDLPSIVHSLLSVINTQAEIIDIMATAMERTDDLLRVAGNLEDRPLSLRAPADPALQLPVLATLPGPAESVVEGSLKTEGVLRSSDDDIFTKPKGRSAKRRLHPDLSSPTTPP